MKFEDFEKHCNANSNDSKAMELLKKVVESAEARSLSFVFISRMCNTKDFDQIEIGGKYLACDTVCRHNGTSENVSVDIQVCQKTSNHDSCRLFKVRVPKDASDNVINKRITAAVEEMAK